MEMTDFETASLNEIQVYEPEEGENTVKIYLSS